MSVSDASFEQKLRSARRDFEKAVGDHSDSSRSTSHAPYRAQSVSGESHCQPVQRKLTTAQAVVIFITNEIGIGVLSLPAVLHSLGIFPGLVAIIGMGLLSMYTAYILVQFWRKYPYVLNIVDYGRVLGGEWLEAIFAIGFLINMALISASAIITITIGLNTISNHGLCTIAFNAIVALAMWLLCIPRTMKFVAWCGWPCTVSILAAVFIVMISLGVTGPRDKSIPLGLQAIGNLPFTGSTSAFLNAAFAFTGNQAYPTVLAEMENPSRDFPRAIVIEKTFTIILDSIVAVICYRYAGQQVTSPALGAASPVLAKVAYGVIFVSLLGTGLVFGHTATKFIHVAWMRHFHLFRLGRQRERSVQVDPNRHRRRSTLQVQGANRKTVWVTWVIVVTLFWILTWVIAGAIPIFDSLLNISASLLLSWFTWGFPAIMWFHLNWNGRWRSSWKKLVLAALNTFILAVVLFMTGGGMYASIANMLDIFNDPLQPVRGPFSCADNSLTGNAPPSLRIIEGQAKVPAIVWAALNGQKKCLGPAPCT